MLVSQKCQYAIRAVYELVKRHNNQPIKICDIAEAHAIPPRFLEAILFDLKRAGFVDSKRGSTGGYFLSAPIDSLTIGQIVESIDGPQEMALCSMHKGDGDCLLHGKCAFSPMWQKVQQSVLDIYDSTTFSELVDQERKRCQEAYASQYYI